VVDDLTLVDSAGEDGTVQAGRDLSMETLRRDCNPVRSRSAATIRFPGEHGRAPRAYR